MALLSLVLILSAWFHSDTDSSALLVTGPGHAQLELTCDADRLMQAVGLERPDFTDWQEAEVKARQRAIEDYFRAHYELLADGRPLSCRLVELVPVRAFEPVLDKDRIQLLTLQVEFEWPAGDFLLTVEHQLFALLETGHRHTLRLRGGDEQASFSLYQDSPEDIAIQDQTARGKWLRWRRTAAAGWRHGAAHPGTWLFLLVVLAVGRGRTTRRAALTAMTVAHAGAMAMVASQVLAPRAGLVAAAAAFAISYLAGENLLAPTLRLRWLTVGLFGILYGLRDASGLREALPGLRQGVGLATAGFEIGLLGSYLTAASVCLPLIYWLTPPRSHPLWMKSLLLVALAAGAALMVDSLR